jgi:hypothetical protein
VSFNDDVLGIGVAAQRTPSGKLKSLSSPLDIISKDAFFNDQLRSM